MSALVPAAPLSFGEIEIVQARAEFTRGNNARAVALACAALKANPRSFNAHLLLGELALSRPDGAAVAEKVFRQALALRLRDSDAERLLAAALTAQGRRQEAIELLQRSTRAHPTDTTALLELSKLCEAEHQFDSAEAALRQATRAEPTSMPIARCMGDMLKRRGRLVEALVWHRRAAGSADSRLPAAGFDERRHAVFIMQQGLAWSCLSPIYSAFAADAAWKTTVVAVPFRHSHYSTDEERNRIFGFLETEGVPYIRWDEFELTARCADVAFLSLPYEETFPKGWRIDDLIRAIPRLVYVPYALVIVGGEENTQCQFDLPLQQRAWMVVAHSERNKAMFVRHCKTGDAHVVVTGHPKIDAASQLESVNDEELPRFAAGRKIVCWNPHFDLRPNDTPWGAGCSTFFRWQEFLLGEFARRPDMVFVIRPHPLFFSSLEKRKLWTRAQRADFLARVESTSNVLIDHRPSYATVFATANAMISDASSLLIEYAVTGNPLLYLRNPHGPALNDDGEFVREHFYTAEREEEIRKFLDMVAAGEDPRAASRELALPGFVHRPIEGAATAVKRAVVARLAAENPATPSQLTAV
jgi:hypothetical protein